MYSYELYLILFLIIIILYLVWNTIRFYFGEKKKVKHLHRFAKEGEIEAQQKLAKRYKKGDMVKKDCQKAAFWYQKASFSGDLEAKGYLEEYLDENIEQNKKC